MFLFWILPKNYRLRKLKKHPYAVCVYVCMCVIVSYKYKNSDVHMSVRHRNPHICRQGENMKSMKTMLAQAKQFCYDECADTEIVYNDQKIIGYWISDKKLIQLYRIEGFLESTCKKHLQVWKDAGLARTFGHIVFIVPSPGEIEYDYLIREKKDHPEAIVIVGEATA